MLFLDNGRTKEEKQKMIDKRFSIHVIHLIKKFIKFYETTCLRLISFHFFPFDILTVNILRFFKIIILSDKKTVAAFEPRN